MARRRFNPPPNWPAPPSRDWMPPPGWKPDPSWPPAPYAWQFWVEDTPPKRRGRGLLAGVGALAVLGAVIAGTAQGDDPVEPQSFAAPALQQTGPPPTAVPATTEPPRATPATTSPRPRTSTTPAVTRTATRAPRPSATRTTQRPKATPKRTSNCDPNYRPCVPIASDVDCAGGSGNGPAYVTGPVRVIGRDIYDLDRDGDGVGCD